MDAVKLKSSCICGNTKPYLDCCGRYSENQENKPFAGNDAEKSRADFRHAFHELYMYLFSLRNLYQAYWEKLSEESYPHHLLMSDGEYGKAIVANFFWDYSVQFSDARPILRAARDVEGKSIRLANDFRQWSLAPLWMWYVIEAQEQHGYLRMLGSDKVHRVVHGGELPAAGTYIAARVLPYRGEEHLHPAVLSIPGENFSDAMTEEKFLSIRESLGLRSGAGLRPDVHCDEWRRHGALFLAFWRQRTYDSVVGIPARTVSAVPGFTLPVTDMHSARRQLDTSGAISIGKGRYEVRHRALTLARLDLHEEAIDGTLIDDAYRPYMLQWLEDHLNVVEPGDIPIEGFPPVSKAQVEKWIHSALSVLKGETPMEASLHDFGRRKLRALLDGVSSKGRDVSVLRQRLGL